MVTKTMVSKNGSSKRVLCGIIAALTSLTFVSAASVSPRSTVAISHPSRLASKIFLTRDEALSLAFPKCEVERTTAYLDSKAVKAIAALAKVDFSSRVVYPYRATRDGKWIGTAYFDTHSVRALRETVMIVVKPDGTLGRIELLVFAEPKEYIPRKKWYDQFLTAKLDKDLYLKRRIRPVTGATLTAQATTKCARRVLALHSHLQQVEAMKRQKKKDPVGKIATVKKSK